MGFFFSRSVSRSPSDRWTRGGPTTQTPPGWRWKAWSLRGWRGRSLSRSLTWTLLPWRGSLGARHDLTRRLAFLCHVIFFFINYHDAKGPGWALVDVSKDCVLQDSVDELLFIIYTKAYYYTVFLLLFFLFVFFNIHHVKFRFSSFYMCHVTILFCYYLLST